MTSRPLRRALALASLALALGAGSAAADVTQKEARRWKPDIAAARDFAQTRAGHVGFAVFDIRGRLHHHNGGGRAVMASTFKVMLMVAYLRQDSVEDRALNGYDKSLLRPMIRKSDNASATTILAMNGDSDIQPFMRQPLAGVAKNDLSSR